jgi:hypothetical protein
MRLVLLFSILTAPLIGKGVNFPIFENDATFGASFLQSANEYYDIYSTYSQAFSKYYGQAITFGAMNNYPIGIDDLGGFPGIYAGIGMGSVSSNTNGLKRDADENTSSSLLPSALPTLGISLNLGIALSNNWDLRLGLFPGVDIALPQPSESVTGTIKNASFLIKPVYHIKRNQAFTPGISISGIVGYSAGGITLNATGLTSESFPFSTSYSAGGQTATIPGSADYTFDIKTNAKWEYYTIGSEVRLWYNLFFFIPYVGLGLAYNTGTFITEMQVPATINATLQFEGQNVPNAAFDVGQSVGSCPANGAGVNQTAGESQPNTTTLCNVKQQSTGDITISESATPINPVQARIIAGLQFKVLLVSVTTELQVELQSQALGASMAAAVSF